MKVVFFTVVALVFAAGCSQTEEVVETVHETPVEVAEVVTGALSGSNQFTGTAHAGSDVQVIPKGSGELVDVQVSKGDNVERGQVLARINDEDQRIALRQEQATLRQAQSGLQRAENGLAQAKGNYNQAVASLEQAEAGLKEAKESRDFNLENLEYDLDLAKDQLEEAEKNLDRMEQLYNEGLISTVEYDEAVNAEKQARSAVEQLEVNKRQAESETSLLSLQSSVDQAQIGVDLAQSSVRDAEIGVEDAKISVEQANMAVEAAQKRVDDMVIKAPASGEVVSLESDLGEMVTNQSPFARLVTLDKVKATVNVSAEQLILFEYGDEIEVDFSGLEETRTGTVSYISPTSNDSGLFTVEVEVNNSEREIRPGMVATLVIEEVLVEDSMIVPTTVIIERQDDIFVYIVDGDQAVRKDVEVIRYDTEFSAVVGEINEGDEVVTRGQNLLSDGDLIRVIKEDD
ncbi:efflux RND transporter periplasmic adaptor subunit [Desertibacillus haloalkaliphilus]|nr:efflux RND transporter periplasmic adaptor subunit [Desertibacillus haloalkaliphilus]